MKLFAFSASLVTATASLEPVEANVSLIVTPSKGPTRNCTKTPGLPSWARGMYIVSGPAGFNVSQYQFKAIFDGFGMTNRFELLDEEVCFTSVWMDTQYRNESLKWKCPPAVTFEGTEPKRPLTCLNFAAQDNDGDNVSVTFGKSNDNDWVNVISFGGEMLMLTDSPNMLRMDPDTLSFSGKKEWDNDKVPTTLGSAHPVQRPGTETWVGIAAKMGLKSKIDIFTYDAAKPHSRPINGSTGPLKHPPFMHSYGVTANYVVMPINLGMGIGKDCSSFGLLCGMVTQWQGIHVIDKDGVVTVFDKDGKDPFYHVHIVNAFESTDEHGSVTVTLDVGAYDQSPFAVSGALDINLYLNKSARDSNPIRANMTRVNMTMSGPNKGTVTRETFKKIPNSHTDFYRLNPNNIGRPYCFYYGTQWWHDGVNYANMAIMKHNLCTDTTTYWTAVDHYVGEPFFIPNPANKTEDDGILVFVALDGPNGNSKFVTIDARSMQEVNGTDVTLPTHIPFTAHGNWFPAQKPGVITV